MIDHKLSKKRKFFNILKKRYISKKNMKGGYKIIINKDTENFTVIVKYDFR